MADQLTALDATFLELEQRDEGATMHIGGVMVFDPLPGTGAPSLEEVRVRLGERLGRLPRYTQRLSSERTGGVSWPYWCEDPRFDVRAHVGHAALPAPGGDAELCEWAGDFFSHRLDRTRPLWEMALLEGLEGGRWGLASKTHHALVDGVGSVGVVRLLLDVEPEAPEEGGCLDGADAPWEVEARHGEDTFAEVARSALRVAGAGLHAATHPREAVTRSRALAELLVRNELAGAPRTTLNVRTGATRSYSLVRADLAQLKAIGHELGGSVNDVLLAACTEGIRRLMHARGERPPVQGVRAMVPMNLRRDAEQLALGNRISSLFVDLPVAEADALERMQTIAARTRALKGSDAALGAATMIDLAGLAPPVLHSALARSLYATRLFNVTITNVPGPQFPLYGFGARLHEVHPLVPLAAEHAVGIAIFSYDGAVVLGISADRDSVPDLEVLADGVHEGLVQLGSLAPAAVAAHAARSRRSSRHSAAGTRSRQRARARTRRPASG